MRAKFNLQCYTFEGIDAIKEALLVTKEKTSDDKFNLTFQLNAPPEYWIEVFTEDKQGGSDRLDEALKVVSEEITKRGGIFKKIQGPTRITAMRHGDVNVTEIQAQMMENQGDSTGEEDPEIASDLDDDIQDDMA